MAVFLLRFFIQVLAAVPANLLIFLMNFFLLLIHCLSSRVVWSRFLSVSVSCRRWRFKFRFSRRGGTSSATTRASPVSLSLLSLSVLVGLFFLFPPLDLPTRRGLLGASAPPPLAGSSLLLFVRVGRWPADAFGFSAPVVAAKACLIVGCVVLALVADTVLAFCYNKKQKTC